jgi:hypothetical protein
VSLGLCLLIAPVSGFRFTVNVGLIIPVLFLGLLISVVAQLLLYRLLSAGNIVNVTSLFYLVPKMNRTPQRPARRQPARTLPVRNTNTIPPTIATIHQ